MQLLDTSCGSEVNYPLGGNLPITQKPAYVTRGARLVSVVSTTTHMYTVVFMGTDDGNLKKVSENRKIRFHFFASETV